MRHPSVTILLGLLLAAPGVRAADPPRAMAVTLDDLPLAGRLQDPATVESVTTGILDALSGHHARAAGFVTTRNVLRPDQVDLRLDALRRWIHEGHTLENHSYTHPSFARTPLAAYEDDAIQGDTIPRMLMAENDREPRYYRHPYNHTGATVEDKTAFERFMAGRGYTIAPFTVEHADYIFNRLYEDAVSGNDAATAGKIGEAYLAHLDVALDFAEKLAADTFGREIPQILLIHANTINARYLDRMLERLEARGYRFVSLETAMQDEALRTPEEYVGPRGISWLHRWRHTIGLEDRFRDEPDPPRWVLDAYRE